MKDGDIDACETNEGQRAQKEKKNGEKMDGDVLKCKRLKESSKWIRTHFAEFLFSFRKSHSK